MPNPQYFQMPITVPYRFGYRHGHMTFYGVPHRGVDLIIPSGTPVRSPFDGTVSYCRWNEDYGYEVKLVMNGGRVTSYMCHLMNFTVRAGQTVKRGEMIGLSGNTGRLTTAPHLHWHGSIDGKVVDPLLYLTVKDNEITMLIQNHVDKTSKFFKDLENGVIALGFDKGRAKPYIIRNSKKKYYNTVQELYASESMLWTESADADKIANQ